MVSEAFGSRAFVADNSTLYGFTMKKLLVFIVGAFTLLSACSAENNSETADASGTKSKADVSYAFGVAIGNTIKGTAVEIDYDSFLKGVKDYLEQKDLKISLEDASPIIQAAIGEAMEKKAAASADTEKTFLEQNGKKDGVKTTASGLQYEVVSEGTGAHPVATDTVKVNYVGTLIDGSKFDSSIDRGEPAVFPLNGVIPGWTEGIQLMSVGSKYKFYIPSNLAYGANGAGGVIGPNETLIFEVDLLSIEDASTESASN